MNHSNTCICREHPLPARMTVRAARDAYLAENGFTVEAYDEPTTPASFFALRFSVPNTPLHRWAIMLHDLHHVATGYGTDIAGEAEISAWETRRGLGALDAYVTGIVGGLAWFGLAYAPIRVVRAFRASASAGAPSLFVEGVDYDALLALSVAALRGRLGVPEYGLFEGTRRLHARAPASVDRGAPGVVGSRERTSGGMADAPDLGSGIARCESSSLSSCTVEFLPVLVRVDAAWLRQRSGPVRARVRFACVLPPEQWEPGLGGFGISMGLWAASRGDWRTMHLLVR